MAGTLVMVTTTKGGGPVVSNSMFGIKGINVALDALKDPNCVRSLLRYGPLQYSNLAHP
jgi:hypothetical protein